MPDRLDLLEKIAAKAAYLRALERELVPTPNPRRVLNCLKETRLELDELLDDLERLDP